MSGLLFQFTRNYHKVMNYSIKNLLVYLFIKIFIFGILKLFLKLLISRGIQKHLCIIDLYAVSLCELQYEEHYGMMVFENFVSLLMPKLKLLSCFMINILKKFNPFFSSVSIMNFVGMREYVLQICYIACKAYQNITHLPVSNKISSTNFVFKNICSKFDMKISAFCLSVSRNCREIESSFQKCKC